MREKNPSSFGRANARSVEDARWCGAMWARQTRGALEVEWRRCLKAGAEAKKSVSAWMARAGGQSFAVKFWENFEPGQSLWDWRSAEVWLFGKDGADGSDSMFLRHERLEISRGVVERFALTRLPFHEEAVA